MTDVTKEQVFEKLRTVRGPELDGNIVDLGLVSDVFISDGKAYFSITVPAERARELDPMRAAAERVVKEIPGIKAVMVALTADKKAASGPAAARAPAPPPPGRGEAAHSHSGHDHAGHSHAAPAQPQQRAKSGIP